MSEGVISERSLLRQARKLDPQTLAVIYDQYSPGIFRYAYRQLGDVEMAEDCVAETFSRLLQALSKGGGPRKHLQAYLYRVAHNWITDQFRKQSPPYQLEDQIIADPEVDVHKSVEKKLRQEQVRAALAQLTPDQRQVIVLKYLEELQNKEVAEILGKPVGAVKSLQHRALQALQRLLVHDEEYLK